MSGTSVSRIGIKISTSKLIEAEVAVKSLYNILKRLDKKGGKFDAEKSVKRVSMEMKTAVLDFSTTVLNTVSSNTPIGSEARLSSDANYRRLYELRQGLYGIEARPGFHQGAYVYSEVRNPPFVPEIRSAGEMTSDFVSEFNSGYKIGDTFYIAATGPAYEFFQKGLIGNDPVASPTLDQVMQIYSTKKISI